LYCYHILYLCHLCWIKMSNLYNGCTIFKLCSLTPFQLIDQAEWNRRRHRKSRSRSLINRKYLGRFPAIRRNRAQPETIYRTRWWLSHTRRWSSSRLPEMELWYCRWSRAGVCAQWPTISSWVWRAPISWWPSSASRLRSLRTGFPTAGRSGLPCVQLCRTSRPSPCSLARSPWLASWSRLTSLSESTQLHRKTSLLRFFAKTDIALEPSFCLTLIL